LRDLLAAQYFVCYLSVVQTAQPSTPARLDAVLLALAHTTRRGVVERLGRGPASVSELAASYDVALPSFVQHLRVLEDAGLVTSQKSGRVRTYALAPQALKPVEGWLNEQRDLWTRRLDQLDHYLLYIQEPDE
jgi:DNA-binding transcriptional ArsR family regulator